MSAWFTFRGTYFWLKNKIKNYMEYIQVFYGVL